MTRPVAVIVAGSAGTSLLATLLVGEAAGPAIVLGMLGPLLAVTISWVVIEREHRRNPAGVAALMVRAFVAKFLFFGAYAAIVVGAIGVNAVFFLASFTVYFIALYAVEAVLLQRLSARSVGGS
jgi:hypothetical protein